MTPANPDEGTPVSVKIRERIAASRKRFHANDNIAEFLQPGDLEKLLDEVADKMKGVLSSLVIDTEHDHNTGDTARRVAKMYVNEVFRGRYVTAPNITEFPNAGHLNELMIVGPITVRSACSHHFCPVIGKIWIVLQLLVGPIHRPTSLGVAQKQPRKPLRKINCNVAQSAELPAVRRILHLEIVPQVMMEALQRFDQ